MTRMPTKREIEKEATRLHMERGWDISPTLPEREELIEEGLLKEAQRNLMSSRPSEHATITDKQAKAEQTKYVHYLAGEMGLRVVSKKDFQKYEKGVTNEWRFMQKVKKAQFEREKLRKSWLDTLKREKQLKRKYARQLPKVQAFDVFRAKYPGRVVKVNGYKIVLPAIPQPKKPKSLPRVSLRKPLDVGSAIRGAPKPKLPQIRMIPKKPYTQVSQDWNKLIGIPSPYAQFRKEAEKKGFPKEYSHKYAIFHSYKKMRTELHGLIPKPKKKRRKNHTQRSGKTMRKLRKVKGVKVFSFPDHIWKVRNK